MVVYGIDSMLKIMDRFDMKNPSSRRTNNSVERYDSIQAATGWEDSHGTLVRIVPIGRNVSISLDKLGYFPQARNVSGWDSSHRLGMFLR